MAPDSSPGKWFEINVLRAGELFMKGLWIQSQMSVVSSDAFVWERVPDLQR